MRILPIGVAFLLGAILGAMAATVWRDQHPVLVPPPPSSATPVVVPPPSLPQLSHPAPTVDVQVDKRRIVFGPWRFLEVPAGCAQLGSPDDEPGRSADEKLHAEFVTERFYLLETEVPESLVEFAERGEFVPSDNLPVSTMSFDDTQLFCEVLGRRVPQLRFRLPTDVEWEHAARQLCRTALPLPTSDVAAWETAVAKANAGDQDFLDRFAKHFACFGESQPRACGQLKPNSLGLFDMSGNVWEWTETDRAPSPDLRPVRGGAWSSTSVWNCRAASCSWENRTTRKSSIGFRIVAEVP